MLDELARSSAQPAAMFMVLSLAATAAIFIMPIIVVVGGFIVNWFVRIVYISKFSGSDFGTHITQPIVAAIFFCFFTSRISAQHRLTTFIAVSVFILVLGAIVYWVRARYRTHFSEILFDERFIHPVWEAISSQRRLLVSLGAVAPLRPLLWSIKVLTNQIHYRQWQLFFGTLAVFSFYTLPVELFPGLDRWLLRGVHAVVEEFNGQWIVESPLYGKAVQMAGSGYLYLFDWGVTVLGVYGLIVLFAPLEPRNTFSNVSEALRDFVRKGKVFLFSGFFWQYGSWSSRPAVYTRDKERADSFEPVAKLIHDETLLLDAALRGSFHGNSCRVALVYEPVAGSDAKVRNPYCFHYRRLGKSSFLAAADAHAKRFDGSNARSQIMFHQLAESIGYLVNVRHSLK